MQTKSTICMNNIQSRLQDITISLYTSHNIHIQGVTGGTDQTSERCSLC